MNDKSTSNSPARFLDQVEVRGHIIDSLLLPKILDCITSGGGAFRIEQIEVGQARNDPSFAVIEVEAPSQTALDEILAQISDHGAVPTSLQDAQLIEADVEGAFPEGFYSSTNQKTEVRIDGNWIAVQDQEMDCGVVVDAQGKTAHCIPMCHVEIGMQIIVGHAGVRVSPEQRDEKSHGFEFMTSSVSTEKPKGAAIRSIAADFVEAKKGPGKTLVVGGPAIVHTGSIEHLGFLIREGYVDKLFAGNALATHDIEHAMYGTSLGVHLDRGDIAEAGHEHHLRTINRVRRAGGIRQAVEQKLIRSGIMYECIKNDTEFLLAGSIRDDGPLPEVITDSLEAQDKMREAIRDVSFCLMVATTLHSVAVGNLLPAWVKVICVDINPSAVIKLSDRGSFQTVGLVTDVAPFMRALVEEVKQLERSY